MLKIPSREAVTATTYTRPGGWLASLLEHYTMKQRATLVLYFILLIYCCLWIPWRIPVNHPTDIFSIGRDMRAGYGLLWAGPVSGGQLEKDYRRPVAQYATPDWPLISLRLVAATAFGAAAFLLARARDRPHGEPSKAE